MSAGTLETVTCPDCGAPSPPDKKVCWMCGKDIAGVPATSRPADPSKADLPKTRTVLLGAFLLLCAGFAVHSLMSGFLALLAALPGYITMVFVREVRTAGGKLDDKSGWLEFLLRGAFIIFLVGFAVFFALMTTCTFMGAVATLGGK